MLSHFSMPDRGGYNGQTMEDTMASHVQPRSALAAALGAAAGALRYCRLTRDSRNRRLTRDSRIPDFFRKKNWKIVKIGFLDPRDQNNLFNFHVCFIRPVPI